MVEKTQHLVYYGIKQAGPEVHAFIMTDPIALNPTPWTTLRTKWRLPHGKPGRSADKGTVLVGVLKDVKKQANTERL